MIDCLFDLRIAHKKALLSDLSGVFVKTVHWLAIYWNSYLIEVLMQVKKSPEIQGFF